MAKYNTRRKQQLGTGRNNHVTPRSCDNFGQMDTCAGYVQFIKVGLRDFLHRYLGFLWGRAVPFDLLNFRVSVVAIQQLHWIPLTG